MNEVALRDVGQGGQGGAGASYGRPALIDQRALMRKYV